MTVLKEKTIKLKIYSFFFYENPFKKIIKSKFYDEQSLITIATSQYCKDILINQKELFVDAILVPIPIHWTRKITRGFNQAEIISSIMEKKLLTKSVHLLYRHKKTKFQNTLSVKDRQTNLDQAFGVNLDYQLKKPIVLIDDLCTTGTTLLQATKVLKAHGFEVKAAVTLAKG